MYAIHKVQCAWFLTVHTATSLSLDDFSTKNIICDENNMWMRSIRVWMSRSSPGFDPRIIRHSGAVDEAVVEFRT